MIPPVDRPEADASCRSAAVARRLRLLVGAHLFVGAAPLLSLLVPLEVRFLPLIWATASVSLAQLMLLAFWVGMGTSRGMVRVAGGLMGSAYVATWPALISILSPHSQETPWREVVAWLLRAVGANCLMVLLFAGIFFLMRRWFTELRRVPDPAGPRPAARFQFSILHLLVIASIVAIVLGLMRSARPAGMDAAAPRTSWEVVAAGVLMVVVFVVNAVCAVRAPLAVGPIGIRIFLVLLVAILLGAALGLVLHYDLLTWWQLLFDVLALAVPTVVVVVSLLVVRRCGYRLVPKGTAPTGRAATVRFPPGSQ